jgi:hypothetical protein
MKLEVFPSLDPNLPKYIDDRDASQHTLTWWRPGDYLRHPFLATPVTMFPGSRNLRGKLRAPKDIRILFTSNGRSFETTEQIGHWIGDNIEGRDVVVAPDLPPGEDFDRAMKASKKEFDTVASLCGPTGSILGTIRGTTLTAMELWMRAIGAVDGYAIAAFNDLRTILYGMMLHHEFFPKQRLHFSGVSGERAFEVITYYARQTEAPVSIDTTAHLGGITAGIYYRPYDVRAMARLLRGDELDFLPCDCAVCKDQLDLVGTEKSISKNVPLALHNLAQIIRYARLVETIQVERKYFRELYAQNEVVAIINAYEHYLARGYDAVRDSAAFLDVDFDPAQTRIHNVPFTQPAPRCGLCGDEEGKFDYILGSGPTKLCFNCFRFYEEADEVLQSK